MITVFDLTLTKMSASHKRVWPLSNGAILGCRLQFTVFSQAYVTLYTTEDDTTEHGIKVYPAEFERLKVELSDFMHYVQLGPRYTNGYVKPAVVIRMDPPHIERSLVNEGYIVDCSRSLEWVLVRYGRLGKDCEQPRTVTAMERQFPIKLAVHTEDFSVLHEALEEIEHFFHQ